LSNKINQREIKALIATQTYFKGELSQNNFSIKPAPNKLYKPMDGLSGFSGYLKDWHYYTLSIRVPEKTREQIIIPNLSFEADFSIILLNILYGKIFENYGFLEGATDFLEPNLTCRNFSRIASMPFNSNILRKDFSMNLDLSHCYKILPLLSPNFKNKKFIEYLYAAGRLYSNAIQEAQYNPENAYLNLISCGEILSGFYKFEDDEIYDRETLEYFKQIHSLKNGSDIVKKFKGDMRKIKLKFLLTIRHLLTNDFFNTTESKDPHFSLKADDIEERLKSAYDLRSKYVHVGVEFGKWVSNGIRSNNEILGIKTSSLINKKYLQLFESAPSIIGLERIMRYCLLRFIHLNGCRIDNALDGKGLI
jgi:hypothetical protein